MPSSKGEPTDPELREKIKEEVKAESKGKFTMSRQGHDRMLTRPRRRARQVVSLEGRRDGQAV